MKCKIKGCNKAFYARGFCKKHYTRWLKHGDPLKTLIAYTDRGKPATFLKKAIAYRGDDCLIWPYGQNGGGYGRIRIDGRMQLTHRLVCEAVYGNPPPKHEAAHSCGKGHEGCVNPAHLRWATRAENQADKLIHGTHQYGERNCNAKLTETDVHKIRQMLGTGQTQRSIAVDFGVHGNAIGEIASGRNWAWLEDHNGTS